MMRARWVPAIFVGGAVLLASGCRVPREKYQAPVAPQVDAKVAWSAPVTGGAVVKEVDEASLAHWWSVFEDAELSSLEERALKSNLDLRTATSEIAQAQATREYYRANLYPTVSGSLSGGGTATTTRTGAGANTSSNSLGLTASWEPDFFGGLRKNVAAYEATLEAKKENLRSVMVSLTAELALDYIDLRSYQAQLQVTESNLVKYRETAEMTRAKRESGLASDLDVTQAMETVQSTEAGIPTLETNIKKSSDAIAILLGVRPGSMDEELAAVKPVPKIPASVAVGIPADLIRRRPDVRMAERNYAAQWNQLGVAKANMYPTFTLSGSFASSAAALLNVVTTNASSVSSITGAFSQTLLNRKALKAQVHLQSALLDQYELAYESSVLGAVQDVEDALKAYGAEQVRNKSLAESADSAEKAAAMSQDLYASGLKDFLTVLDSERTMLAAQQSLVVSDATVAENLVRVYKAMGGGWQ